MINKTDILKMISHVNRKNRGFSDRKIINPKREWGLGLILFFISLVLALAFSAYKYETFFSIEVDVSGGTSSVVRYDENSVARALEHYRELQLKFFKQLPN